MPRIIGTIISHGFASMAELDTCYGTEDLFDMLEIISVDSHNQHILNTPKE